MNGWVWLLLALTGIKLNGDFSDSHFLVIESANLIDLTLIFLLIIYQYLMNRPLLVYNNSKDSFQSLLLSSLFSSYGMFITSYFLCLIDSSIMAMNSNTWVALICSGFGVEACRDQVVHDKNDFKREYVLLLNRNSDRYLLCTC